MGLKGRLVSEFELRSSADMFHAVLCYDPHSLSNVSEVINACELLEGEHGMTGSIVNWHYIQDGKSHSAKEKITVDEENKKIVYTVIGGDLMELYKTCVITLHVTSGRNGMDLVRCTIDYEKLADTSVPIPTALLGVIVTCCEHLESHHLNTAA